MSYSWSYIILPEEEDHIGGSPFKKELRKLQGLEVTNYQALKVTVEALSEDGAYHQALLANWNAVIIENIVEWVQRDSPPDSRILITVDTVELKV